MIQLRKLKFQRNWLVLFFRKPRSFFYEGGSIKLYDKQTKAGLRQEIENMLEYFLFFNNKICKWEQFTVLYKNKNCFYFNILFETIMYNFVFLIIIIKIKIL